MSSRNSKPADVADAFLHDCDAAMFFSIDTTDAQQNGLANAELERYCEEHPRSPSALRRPRVMLRGPRCIALLGTTLEDGIAGIGSTVTDALRAFDVEYLEQSRG